MLGLLYYGNIIGACMHHIQCNWYTSVWDACGLCYFAQVLPAVLLYCCGLAFLGLVAWSQFCGYRSAARLMRSRITRIRLLFSKQFDSETSFRSNLRSSWLLGGPNSLVSVLFCPLIHHVHNSRPHPPYVNQIHHPQPIRFLIPIAILPWSIPD